MMGQRHRKLAAASLVELIVSMAIMALLMVMLSNILTNTLVATRKSSARSLVREEIAVISDKLVSSIRAAETIVGCTGSGSGAECRLAITGGQVVWKLCDATGGTSAATSLCQYDENSNLLYVSSSNISISRFSLEPAGSGSGNSFILVTLVADHIAPELGITNITRQTAAVPRNFTITKTTTPTNETTRPTYLSCNPTDRITFENVTGVTQAENTLIGDQFLNSHKIRFRNSTFKHGPSSTFNCASSLPRLAKSGTPTVAHEGSSGAADQIATLAVPMLGSWFLTDDSVIDVNSPNALVPCTLVIEYTTPTLAYSFDLIDMDQGDAYQIFSYGINGNEITSLRKSVSSNIGENLLDAKPYRVSTVSNLADPIQKIEIVANSINVPSRPRTLWGLSFDNFSPTCN